MRMENVLSKNSDSSFYAGLHEWDYIKCTTIILKVFLNCTGSILLYGVIWYERHSVDIRYRTLMNQMLSGMCTIHLFGGVFNTFNFMLVFLFQHQSQMVCHVATFFTRLCFVASLTQLVWKQMIKYLFIFHGKYIVTINDDFAARFLFRANLFGTFILNFVATFFGNHNSEVNYHICTGQKISANINVTLRFFDHHGRHRVTPVWLQTNIGPDPVEHYTIFCAMFILTISLNSWIYKNRTFLNKLRLMMIIFSNSSSSVSQQPTKPISTKCNNIDYLNKKLSIEAGQVVAILFLSLVFIFPTIVLENLIRFDENRINYGAGRFFAYAYQLSIPLFFTNIFPIWILYHNPKMIKTLKREWNETKAAIFFNNVLEFFSKLFTFEQKHITYQRSIQTTIIPIKLNHRILQNK